MASSIVTIKIEKATLQLLEELREETNSKNFDEVIREAYQTLSFYEKEPVLRKRGFAYAKRIAGKEKAEKRESLICTG